MRSNPPVSVQIPQVATTAALTLDEAIDDALSDASAKY
jgi:hypothetical protein